VTVIAALPCDTSSPELVTVLGYCLRQKTMEDLVFQAEKQAELQIPVITYPNATIEAAVQATLKFPAISDKDSFAEVG